MTIGAAIRLWQLTQPASKPLQTPKLNRFVSHKPLVVVVYRRFPAKTTNKKVVRWNLDLYSDSFIDALLLWLDKIGYFILVGVRTLRVTAKVFCYAFPT